MLLIARSTRCQRISPQRSSSSQIEQTVARSSEEVSRLSGDLNVLVDRFKVA